MALFNAGGPFGTAGLVDGLNLASLFDQRRAEVGQNLLEESEINFANQQRQLGFTNPEIQAQIGLNSPFLNQANRRLQSAASAQRLLAPSAIANAQQGDVSGVNRLLGMFGGVGSFTPQNFSSVGALGLLGPQGIGAGLSLQRSDPLQALRMQILQSQLTNLNEENSARSTGPTFSSGFGSFNDSSFGLGSSTPSFGVVNT